MDVNCVFGTARFLGPLLALAAFQAANAEEASVEASDQPTTLVVTASDAGDMLPQPPVVDGTELVIHSDEPLEPTAIAESMGESNKGTLTVVANSQRKAPLAAIVVDPAVEPAAARAQVSAARTRGTSRGNSFSQGPHRPAAGVGNRSPQSGGRRAAPAHQNTRSQLPMAPAAPAPVQAPNSAPSASPASELLVRSYQLSLTASVEPEYSQIVRWCAEAMRQGLDGESRKFALQLSAWALNRRGQIRIDQGQRETAIADFRAALEFDPTCWRALHNRGVTLAQGGQFAEAFDDITKVIQLNPQFAKAYSNRATLYVQAGDNERALADYDAALKLDPAMLPALVGHGRLCHLMGRLEEGLASLTEAIERGDTSADVVCSRGDLLVDLGRYSEALEEYARAIDLDPNFEHAYRNGAWLLATCPNDAIRDVEGALTGAQAALDCGYGERHAALDTLAAALANAGRFEEAVGTMQQAIEVAPEEARPAYQARQQLYELRQPFRTQPIGEEVQTVEFIEG